ncbi:hypothetical protein PHMEG_00021266 [Phytophthora megakarya]|uniref:Uncharacterized protein n=1 Tax=Phytophthora megakarya TaxID=4795 RepID=A0A225VLM6_9STRA|nr:hypothetical protein PHMEG_00021266 [Phytophthora megakarya]
MSFLLGDADHFDTLGEVLAFIDSCDTGVSYNLDDRNMLLQNILPEGASPTDVCIAQHKALTSKKRKRRNLSSSTRLQQCKKAEILYLRRRVLELEEHVKKLQLVSKRPRLLLPQREPNLERTGLNGKTRWEQLAEDCYEARLASEEKNRSLKAIMANQVQTSETLWAIMRKQTIFQVRFCTFAKHLQANRMYSYPHH